MTPEHLRMDFNQRVTVDTQTMEWLPSPSGTVWRKPLARAQAERGHATSVVRYEPGAAFPRHEHPLGEEILVLEGTFSDETGDYPAGTYLRNPPGSGHAPFSHGGCLLLVKLHQFQPDDLQQISVDTGVVPWRKTDRGALLQLHSHHRERVAMWQLNAGAALPLQLEHAEVEWFVVSGELKVADETYAGGTWVRDPAPANDPVAVVDSTVWIKAGHWAHGKTE